MKTDKRKIKFVLLMLLFLILGYLFLAFVNWQLNPGLWDQFTRTMGELCVLLVSSMFSGLITYGSYK